MLKHYEREKLIWDSSYEPFTKLLLLALNSFVDANGECWPSIETLMGMTAMSRNSVIRKVRALGEQKVLINAERFDSNGRQTSNKYRIDFEEMGRVPQRDPGGEGATERRGRVPQRDPGGATERPREGATVAPDLSIEELLIEPIQKEQKKPLFFESTEISVSKSAEDSKQPNSTSPSKEPEIDGKMKIQARVKKSSGGAVLGASAANPQMFEEWWVSYRKMCQFVGANAGEKAEAWKAWQKEFEVYEGGHFIRANAAYAMEVRAQFARQGKAIGVANGCRYLAKSSKWQDAWERSQLSRSIGVDLADPHSVKQAAKEVARRAERSVILAGLESYQAEQLEKGAR